MTILNSGTRNQYTATAAQTIFVYAFEILDDDDIKVYRGDVLLTKDTDYTVAGVGVDAGGSITLTAGATAGDIYTLYRETAPERLTDYQNSGAFLAQEVNDDHDRQWAVIQENKEAFDRALVVSQTSTQSLPVTLNSGVANQILRWSSDTTKVENVALSTISPGSVVATDFTIHKNDVAAVKLIDTSTVADRQALIVTDTVNGGAFELRNVSSHGLSDTTDIIVIDADWYAERIEPPQITTNTADIAALQMPSVAGTATFANATNNIALTGVGLLSGLEVGDVLSVTGTANNNTEFTVEVITDDDNVIVNQAHAGGATTKSLTDETVACTITMLSKWYDAQIGLGQGVVDLAGSRTLAVTETNTTGRTMFVSVNSTNSTGGRGLQMLVDGIIVDTAYSQDIGNHIEAVGYPVPNGSTYRVNVLVASAIGTWTEQR